MVDFKSKIYYEDNDEVIGAEITVYSEQGDNIGNIQVTSKTDFDDLKSKLDGLDEEYVRLDNLGSNISQLNINAATLSGFSSTDFALIDHNHNVSDISNFNTGLNWQLVYSPTSASFDSANINASSLDSLKFYKCGNLILLHYYLTTVTFSSSFVGTERNILQNIPEYVLPNEITYEVTRSFKSDARCELIINPTTEKIQLRPRSASQYTIVGTMMYIARNNSLPE